MATVAVDDRVRDGRQHPLIKSSRSPTRRGRTRSARLATASVTATANPSMPGVQGARAQIALLPAAVQERHELGVRGANNAPDAERTAELVPGDAS